MRCPPIHLESADIRLLSTPAAECGSKGWLRICPRLGQRRSYFSSPPLPSRPRSSSWIAAAHHRTGSRKSTSGFSRSMVGCWRLPVAPTTAAFPAGSSSWMEIQPSSLASARGSSVVGPPPDRAGDRDEKENPSSERDRAPSAALPARVSRLLGAGKGRRADDALTGPVEDPGEHARRREAGKAGCDDPGHPPRRQRKPGHDHVRTLQGAEQSDGIGNEHAHDVTAPELVDEVLYLHRSRSLRRLQPRRRYGHLRRCHG